MIIGKYGSLLLWVDTVSFRYDLFYSSRWKWSQSETYICRSKGWFYSPLKRALSTAEIVAEAIGYSKDIIVDSRITEYDMGDLTGTPTFEITSRKMAAGKNAEDTKAFLDRVKSFLDEYKNYDGNILMVCHAGVGRIIETMKIGGDPILFYDLPAYPNAEVIKLDWLK